MSSKDSFWFKHDSNARNDIKIISLRMRCGWEGYGVFFAMIECLREERHNRISAVEIDALLKIMQIERHIFDAIIEVGLLKFADGFIFSESLNNRMKAWNKLTKKRREAGKAGGSKPRAKANAKQTESKPKANAKQLLSDMTGSDQIGSEETGLESLSPDVAKATPVAVATKVKKAPVTDIQRLWETYAAAMLKRYGIELTFEGGKTGKLLKQILEGRKLDEAQRIIETYVALNDPYVVGQCHPLTLIHSKITIILSKLKPMSNSVLLGPRLTGWPEGMDDVYRSRWGDDEAAWLKAKALNDAFHAEQRSKKNAV